MSGSVLPIIAVTVLISLGLWLSMRGAGLAEVELLPTHSRRRVRWWQRNARHCQLACAVIVIAATCVQITSTIG